jgi:glycerol-3-phosphate dehydrogenase (NAD(P)+)
VAIGLPAIAGLFAAYLLGSVPAAYLAGRARGVDLRAHGSGNLGATNALRVLGWKVGVPVFLFDALKGFVPALLLLAVVRARTRTGAPRVLASPPIVGHVRPVFLLVPRRRGGGRGCDTASRRVPLDSRRSRPAAALGPCVAAVVAASGTCRSAPLTATVALVPRSRCDPRVRAPASRRRAGRRLRVLVAAAPTSGGCGAARNRACAEASHVAARSKQRVTAPADARLRCAVVGAGAWGTALADLLARNGHDVVLWAREPDVVDGVNARHENARFLADAALDPSLRATTDVRDAVRGRDLVLFAPPSHVLRTVAASTVDAVPADAVVAVASKGIERDTLAVMTDVVADALPGRPVVAVSGPSFAAEVARRQPTALVAASADAAAAGRVQSALNTPEFRVYTHDDVLGVELGGALKNVMAVATGMLEGLGLGFNSRAALITRGLAEMTRLGVALGARGSTFAGLAGVGDLVLTCTGALSRNRAVGEEIGRGRSLAEVLTGRETVAEGVLNAQSARALADRAGVEMPIVNAVHGILFEGAPVAEAVRDLMSRAPRAELD